MRRKVTGCIIVMTLARVAEPGSANFRLFGKFTARTMDLPDFNPASEEVILCLGNQSINW